MTRPLRQSRSLLRHAILNQFPSSTTSDIFSLLKHPHHSTLLFSDLSDLCLSVDLNPDSLKDLFVPYGVYAHEISRDSFIRFIDDEVICRQRTVVIPKSLTDLQSAILSKLCRGIRSHRVQASPLPKEIASERLETARLWSNATRMSSRKGVVSRLRIATFCRLARDLNLVFSPEELIDALFAFFGEKTEAIDFGQFAALFQAF
jgi:hypothetical protein